MLSTGDVSPKSQAQVLVPVSKVVVLLKVVVAVRHWSVPVNIATGFGFTTIFIVVESTQPSVLCTNSSTTWLPAVYRLVLGPCVVLSTILSFSKSQYQVSIGVVPPLLLDISVKTTAVSSHSLLWVKAAIGFSDTVTFMVVSCIQLLLSTIARFTATIPAAGNTLVGC